MKNLILLLLLPIIGHSQTIFYDIDTKQIGVSIQQEIKISKPIKALTAIRYQKYMTNFDIMLGRDIYYDDFTISLFIGESLVFTHYQQTKPSATAMLKVNYYIADNIKASAYYQPTLNDNLFKHTFQHQIGIGINLEL